MAQNSIIELQTINYIVKNKDLSILKNENISPLHFSNTYKDIISYIFDHEKKYGNVPDESTMLSHFGDEYTILEVQERPRYLVDKLKEFLAYVKFANDFANIKKQLDEGDIQGAFANLKTSVEENMKSFGAQGNLGLDIMKDTSRFDEYEQRLSGDQGQAYSLGFDALNDTFGGLLKDDVFLLFARLSHGKSYMMTYLAHALHQQGLNVLFYSGEMETSQVGYRYDSIDSHFSNRALLFGKDFDRGKSVAQYKKYVEELRHRPNYFNVITPDDLDGRFLNMNDIHKFVDERKPDVIFIDQLALMEDVRSTKNTQERIKYGNIMADLRVLANTKRIPVVIAAQANRMSATKDEDGEFTIPEMSHIAESDAVGHHCTRAIAFCTNTIDESGKQMMKVAVRKNRHGTTTEFKVDVDFEHGIFEELKHKRLRSDDQQEGVGF